VTGTNLVSLPAFSTEISGFTIASPLAFDPGNGPITTGSVDIRLSNSDVLVDKNYIIDANFGIMDALASGGTRVARVVNNGIIGNIVGMLINDPGATSLVGGLPVAVTNNDFAYNTQGLMTNGRTQVGTLANVSNNIFWQNAAHTTARSGAAI